jgi:PAS domain S-box-containing protein
MYLHIQRCPKGNEHTTRFPLPYYVFLDGDRLWLQVSEEFAALLGYEPAELVGRSAQQLAPKREYDASFFDQLLQSEDRERPLTFVCKNLTEITVMASLVILEDGCILGLARPLTLQSNGFTCRRAS